MFIFLLILEKEEGRERNINLLFHFFCIHWLLLACALARNQIIFLLVCFLDELEEFFVVEIVGFIFGFFGMCGVGSLVQRKRNINLLFHLFMHS